MTGNPLVVGCCTLNFDWRIGSGFLQESLFSACMLALLIGFVALAAAGSIDKGKKACASRFCLGGVADLNGTVCCSAECGVCGGSGCSRRSGGSAQCCATNLMKNKCKGPKSVECALPCARQGEQPNFASPASRPAAVLPKTGSADTLGLAPGLASGCPRGLPSGVRPLPAQELEKVATCARAEQAESLKRGEEYSPDMLHYRFGDCVKASVAFCRSKEKWGSTSFAVQYKNRANGTKNNYAAISEFMKDYRDKPGFHLPEPDALVVHLRLGDRIDLSKSGTVAEILACGGDPLHGKDTEYLNSIKSAPELLAEAQQNLRPGGKVYLIGGSHMHIGPGANSWPYARCLLSMFQRAGFDTTLRAFEKRSKPDEDFYFMANARFFSMSSGAFSRIIGKVVELQGGRVVGRKFDFCEPGSTCGSYNQV